MALSYLDPGSPKRFRIGNGGHPEHFGPGFGQYLDLLSAGTRLWKDVENGRLNKPSLEAHHREAQSGFAVCEG